MLPDDADSVCRDIFIGLKRGFRTRKEALEYEQKFLLQQATNLDMRFEDFYKLYEEDLKPKQSH